MRKLLPCVIGSLILLGSSRFAAQPGIRDTASAILGEAAKTSRETRTLSADMLLTWQSPGHPEKQTAGSIILMKPNYALLKFDGNHPPKMLASDGVNLFIFSDGSNYIKSDVDPRGEKINEPWWGLPLRYFFTQSISLFGANGSPNAEIRIAPNETIGGRNFRVIVVHDTYPMLFTERLYFGDTNLLEHAIFFFGPEASPTTILSAELTNIKINFPMTADSFRFSPPPGSMLQKSDTDKMLNLGERAPDFTLPSSNGNELSLHGERQGMKATLINFWYLSCAPCRIEFPELEKLYREDHTKGLNIVAVEKGDAAKDVSAYALKQGLTFPILLGGDDIKGSVFDTYHISVFPGTYLLDAEGRIVYRKAGIDMPGLRFELMKLGIN
jgi:peroxiredoxin/outer membrane lipoprotein-sorting protein